MSEYLIAQLNFLLTHYVLKEIWPVMNKTTVVAKRELLYVWPFGVCAWLCGLIFIDRYAAEKAKVAMNTAMEKLKKDNVKLWVFPEGRTKFHGSKAIENKL